MALPGVLPTNSFAPLVHFVFAQRTYLLYPGQW